MALMAVPPVLLSLHTTAGLGAYGETLLIGACLLWIGHRLLTDGGHSWLLWGAFGLLAGVGFWTFGLIAVYLFPVALLMVRKLKWRWAGRYLLCALLFVVGSAPWWWYNLTNDWAALKVFYDPGAGTAIAQLTLGERVLGFLGLGLPALMGLRPSWSIEWVSWPLSPLILALYLAIVAYGVRRGLSKADLGHRMLLLFIGLFCLSMIGTRFGADTSGRYMLPLYVALYPLCGVWLSWLREHQRWWATVVLVFVLGFNLLGNVKAMVSEEGLTTEFWSTVRFDRTSDAALIDFLLDHDLHYGYSNRHTHFRIDFLSDERVLLLPRLSSRSGLCINLDGRGDRYPAYTEQVEGSPVVFYVTTAQPYLDELLRDRYADLGITYKEEEMGPYRVFYDLSSRVSPGEMCDSEDGR